MTAHRIWYALLGVIVGFWVSTTFILALGLKRQKRNTNPVVEITEEGFFCTKKVKVNRVSVVTETRTVNGKTETITKTIFEKE